MGTFERLSVVVIGVILAMILVVAVVTWTDAPEDVAQERADAPKDEPIGPGIDPVIDPLVDPLPPSPLPDPDPMPEPLPPEPAPEPSPGPGPLKVEPKVHKVAAGETPGGISRRYYDTTKYWRELLAFNKVEGDLIRVGQELLIPTLQELGIENIPGKLDQVTPPPQLAKGPKPGAKWTVPNDQDLPTIARLTYGAEERWTDIWLENREAVEDPGHVTAGTVLTLPK